MIAKLPARHLSSLCQRDVQDGHTMRVSLRNHTILVNYLNSNGSIVDLVCGDEVSLKRSIHCFKVLIVKNKLFDTLF